MTVVSRLNAGENAEVLLKESTSVAWAADTNEVSKNKGMGVHGTPAPPRASLGTLDEVTSCAPSLGPGASQVVFPYRPHTGTRLALGVGVPSLFSLGCCGLCRRRHAEAVTHRAGLAQAAPVGATPRGPDLCCCWSWVTSRSFKIVSCLTLNVRFITCSGKLQSSSCICPSLSHDYHAQK